MFMLSLVLVSVTARRDRLSWERRFLIRGYLRRIPQAFTVPKDRTAIGRDWNEKGGGGKLIYCEENLIPRVGDSQKTVETGSGRIFKNILDFLFLKGEEVEKGFCHEFQEVVDGEDG